jgi:hypothetical protein
MPDIMPHPDSVSGCAVTLSYGKRASVFLHRIFRRKMAYRNRDISEPTDHFYGLRIYR